MPERGLLPSGLRDVVGLRVLKAWRMLPDKASPGDLDRNLAVEALPGPEVADRPLLEEVEDEGVKSGQLS